MGFGGRRVLRTLEEKLDPRWSALLAIDVQNDYIHPEGASGRRGGDVQSAVEMMPRLIKLVDAARTAGVRVIYTRNWHGPATDSEPWLERSTRGTGDQANRAGLAGSWGAEWYEIQPAEGEHVINKFRYDAFLGTNLEYYLRAHGIRTVVCCGTATNVCVESTIRAAHMRDHYVVLASDCCAAPDPELHRATLRNVERHFGTLATLSEIEACWAAVSPRL